MDLCADSAAAWTCVLTMLLHGPVCWQCCSMDLCADSTAACQRTLLKHVKITLEEFNLKFNLQSDSLISYVCTD